MSPFRHLGALLVLLLLAMSATPDVRAQGENIGYLRISDVNFPRQLPTSHFFRMNLSVNYAFHGSYQIRAMVYEGKEGNFTKVLWQADPRELSEGGELTYEAQLKSPPTEIIWHLTAYAFYYDRGEWRYFSKVEKGPGFMEVEIKVSNTAVLTVNTSYAGIPFLVDDNPAVTGADGMAEVRLPIFQSHAVEMPMEVRVAEGVRRVFLSWGDGDPSNRRNINLEQDAVLVASYKTQFHLTVLSSVGSPSGQGWYDEGCVTNFSVAESVSFEGIIGMLGVRYVFRGWTGDMKVPEPSASIVMDKPHTVEAVWDVDYSSLIPIALATVAIAVIAVAIFVWSRSTKVSPPPVEPAREERPTRAYCMYCGSSIEPDASYCLKCGREQA